MSTTDTPPTQRRRAPQRRGDVVFAGLSRGSGLVILAALAGVGIFLTIEGLPGLTASEGAYSGQGDFIGYVWPLVFGTVLAALIALIIATPLSVGVALVISHYAPIRFSKMLGYLVDLLAAIPSVVYGLWGINFLATRLVPGYQALEEHLGWLPFFAGPTATTGRTILTAGIVLAVMILPIITAIAREVFLQTPKLNEEAALALGATRWEMIRMAVFPYAKLGPGLRGDARPRPGPRRDDGGRDGALRDRGGHLQPDQPGQPVDDRGQHRAAVPRVLR